MQSLRKKLNGNSEEEVQYARTFGIGKFMEKYSIRDYVAAKNWLLEHTDGQFIPYAPAASVEGNSGFAEKLLDAFIKKLSKMEAEIERLMQEIQRLQVELDYHKGRQAVMIEPKITEIMERCRT
jgi:hypothetical protein